MAALGLHATSICIQRCGAYEELISDAGHFGDASLNFSLIGHRMIRRNNPANSRTWSSAGFRTNARYPAVGRHEVGSRGPPFPVAGRVVLGSRCPARLGERMPRAPPPGLHQTSACDSSGIRSIQARGRRRRTRNAPMRSASRNVCSLRVRWVAGAVGRTPSVGYPVRGAVLIRASRSRVLRLPLSDGRRVAGAERRPTASRWLACLASDSLTRRGRTWGKLDRHRQHAARNRLRRLG